MTQRTEYRMNLDGLESLQKMVGSARARVGVIGSQAAQNHQLREGAGKKFLVNRAQSESITNAELLLIQMFGSLTRNIPPRDPLLAPLERHKRDLIQMISTGKMKAAFERGDIIGMLRLLGVAAEVIVQEAFETQGDGTWPANKKSTVRSKGSSAPLIDTGQLRRAFSSDVVKASSIPSSTMGVGA